MNQPVSQLLSSEPSIGESTKLHATHCGKWTEISENCILNHVNVGDYSYIQPYCNLMFTDVGKFTSIASSVRINPSNHPWWRPSQHHFTYRPGKFHLAEDQSSLDDEVFKWREDDKVVIGHDVWIGHGAIILPGVTIGNGAIVGAGRLVTKDVPAWHIAVGNPAKVLRPRFEDPSIGERLDKLAWWDWEHEKIQRYFPSFQKDAEQFLLDLEASVSSS